MPNVNAKIAFVLAALLAALCAPARAAAPASAPAVTDVQALQLQIQEQQRKIEHLEARVGMPSTPASWTWFILGFVGEFVFFMRFVVQWWASERQKKTVVPMMFWHLSLIGTALVLAYAIYIFSWVFILAYSLNIFIYVRNLAIARRQPPLQAVMEKESE